MNVTIFNVEHGSCAFVKTPTGKTILLDCGTNATTGFTPSDWLQKNGIRQLDQLIVSHFDEDHVADAANVAAYCGVVCFARNPLVSGDSVRQQKAESGGVGPGVDAALGFHARYTGQAPLIDWGVETKFFRNAPGDFADQNNLSLVTFLRVPGLSIVFPGDLERAGWLRLLTNAEFRDELADVNVFVTSHHGRESGYCAEVFAFCAPDIFVTSDTSKSFATQEQDYRQHASGVHFDGQGVRKVLTTRADGTLGIWSVPPAFGIQTRIPI